MSEVIVYPEDPRGQEVSAHLDELPCYGIDLGTTTTLVCVVDPKTVSLRDDLTVPIQFISVPQHSPFEFHPTIEDDKVASMVAIYNGKPYVGLNLYHLKGHSGFVYKKNMFYHWKLELGIDHDPMYPEAVSANMDMPYKIAGGILKYIRKTRLANRLLRNIIITVPASFQANQRQDVLKAAEIAEMQISGNMLIDEPNAAFLGYFNRLTQEEKVEWARAVRNKNVLVVDFGGGTLDLSILNVDFRPRQGITIGNIAISRYNDLGGQDIDTLIAEEELLPQLRSVFDDFDTVDTNDIAEVIMPQLALIGEKLKKGICDKLSLKCVDRDIEEVDVSGLEFTQDVCKIEYLGSTYELGEVTLSAVRFRELFKKLFRGKDHVFQYIDKTVTTISTSISDIVGKAKMGLDEVDYVLFVGGSSFNPLLHSLTKEKLSNAKALVSHEPDKLVAEGAAVYSYFRHIRNVSLIQPITSDAIGAVVSDGTFYPILESGETLPQKKTISGFRFQNNLTREVVVPVCINGVDFPFGEIRTSLPKFYDVDTDVSIEVEVTEDKVFKLTLMADGEAIGKAQFDNPYAMGLLSREEREIFELKKKANQAKRKGDYALEKSSMHSLIWKYSDVDNYTGVVQSADAYIKRFDDEDAGVWNMLNIGNGRLGRRDAARKALQRALELSPDAAYLHYNWSLDLARRSEREALDYLEALDEDIKSDDDVRCKIVLLKNILGMNVKAEAQEIVRDYKRKNRYFGDYCKRTLLPGVFRIADEPYAYVDPQNLSDKNEQDKYLTIQNTPTR